MMSLDATATLEKPEIRFGEVFSSFRPLESGIEPQRDGRPNSIGATDAIYLVSALYAEASKGWSFEFQVPKLINQIIGAREHGEILAILPLLGLRKIADRLDYLRDITKDDDPEEPAMLLASLRELALFFVSDCPPWGVPDIGICPDGSLQAEWIMNRGAVAMEFLPDGLIRFAAISNDVVAGNRSSISGTMAKYPALSALQPFLHPQGTP